MWVIKANKTGIKWQLDKKKYNNIFISSIDAME
jgi:hypothetical protein